MRFRILETTRFGKDVKRMQKRGKSLKKLWDIVDILADGNALEPKHHMHKLKGEWHGLWECHVEADWLLIFDFRDGDVLWLGATGTHSDLFR